MKEPAMDLYEIYDQYHDRVKSAILAKVRDVWTAEDLTQETFVRAFNNIAGLKDREKIAPWLLQIARNLCMDHFRRVSSLRGKACQQEAEAFPMFFPLEKEMEKQQMSRCVQQQLRFLPETYRTVLWLFDVMGMSQKEIAGALDLSIENVKVRLHRARGKFKIILQERCIFEKDERDVLVCEPK
ncbi:MAG: sigma-70 family RNA polymerase sigma factor [Desulfobacteraceae bacterium]|nr:sigma-70 family RNA polymerase sigma factor [Desulfobacteraceae bacterium]